MPPALLLVRFSRVHWLIIPLPLFLLWPLLLLAWLGLGLAWLVTSRPRPGALVVGVTALRVFNALHGTRIGFRGRGGTVYVQVV